MKPFFDGANLLTDRRLGNRIGLSGFAETLGFNEITKDFERLNLHKVKIRKSNY
jgi:hypothetical protein